MTYESTVYPGATGEQHSGLAFNNGFVVGTRAERLVPGDKQHGFRTITKVTSGSTAEAAKVIENIQSDLNIALVNELATAGTNRLGLA